MYQQVDGVMMGSPLGSLIANIYMSELETSLIPKLEDKVKCWTRYVDDTFAFIKPNAIVDVQNILNTFDTKIQFTHEVEQERKITFLDVQIERTGNNKLETSVYRKKTNNNIYMNWYSYSPRSWKIGTLRNLIKRAIMISSTKRLLEDELNHLRKVFHVINHYPYNVIKSIIDDELEKHHQSNMQSDTENQPSTPPPEEPYEQQLIQLNLPFGGEKGQNLIKKLKQNIETTCRDKIKIRVTYTPCKLGSKFQVKDKTKFEHRHNITYHTKCANKKCRSHYIGQTKCRIAKRTLQHNSKDKASHVFNHSKEKKHRRVTIKDVKILGTGYKSNFKRRISEALYIKEHKPDLNKQKDSFKLKLFN